MWCGWPVVPCIVAACVVTAYAATDSPRDKRDLNFIKDIVVSTLTGIRTRDRVKAANEATSTTSPVDSEIPDAGIFLPYDPSIHTVESYLGSNNLPDINIAAGGAVDLIKSGIINEFRPTTFDEIEYLTKQYSNLRPALEYKSPVLFQATPNHVVYPVPCKHAKLPLPPRVSVPFPVVVDGPAAIDIRVEDKKEAVTDAPKINNSYSYQHINKDGSITAFNGSKKSEEHSKVEKHNKTAPCAKPTKVEPFLTVPPPPVLSVLPALPPLPKLPCPPKLPETEIHFDIPPAPILPPLPPLLPVPAPLPVVVEQKPCHIKSEVHVKPIINHISGDSNTQNNGGSEIHDSNVNTAEVFVPLPPVLPVLPALPSLPKLPCPPKLPESENHFAIPAAPILPPLPLLPIPAPLPVVVAQKPCHTKSEVHVKPISNASQSYSYTQNNAGGSVNHYSSSDASKVNVDEINASGGNKYVKNTYSVPHNFLATSPFSLPPSLSEPNIAVFPQVGLPLSYSKPKGSVHITHSKPTTSSVGIPPPPSLPGTFEVEINNRLSESHKPAPIQSTPSPASFSYQHINKDGSVSAYGNKVDEASHSNAGIHTDTNKLVSNLPPSSQVPSNVAFVLPAPPMLAPLDMNVNHVSNFAMPKPMGQVHVNYFPSGETGPISLQQVNRDGSMTSFNAEANNPFLNTHALPVGIPFITKPHIPDFSQFGYPFTNPKGSVQVSELPKPAASSNAESNKPVHTQSTPSQTSFSYQHINKDGSVSDYGNKDSNTNKVSNSPSTSQIESNVAFLLPPPPELSPLGMTNFPMSKPLGQVQVHHFPSIGNGAISLTPRLPIVANPNIPIFPEYGFPTLPIFTNPKGSVQVSSFSEPTVSSMEMASPAPLSGTFAVDVSNNIVESQPVHVQSTSGVSYQQINKDGSVSEYGSEKLPIIENSTNKIISSNSSSSQNFPIKTPPCQKTSSGPCVKPPSKPISEPSEISIQQVHMDGSVSSFGSSPKKSVASSSVQSSPSPQIQIVTPSASPALQVQNIRKPVGEVHVSQTANPGQGYSYSLTNGNGVVSGLSPNAIKVVSAPQAVITNSQSSSSAHTHKIPVISAIPVGAVEVSGPGSKVGLSYAQDNDISNAITNVPVSTLAPMTSSQTVSSTESTQGIEKLQTTSSNIDKGNSDGYSFAYGTAATPISKYSSAGTEVTSTIDSLANNPIVVLDDGSFVSSQPIESNAVFVTTVPPRSSYRTNSRKSQRGDIP